MIDHHDPSTDILVPCRHRTRSGCNFCIYFQFCFALRATTFFWFDWTCPAEKYHFCYGKCYKMWKQLLSKYHKILLAGRVVTDFTQWLISRQNILFFAKIFWWLFVLRVISAYSPRLELARHDLKGNYRI